MEACHVTESTLASGYRAVTLENELVSVVVLPEKGADIYSLLYKPRGMDILWKSPWGLPPHVPGRIFAGGNTEAAWMDQYEGGWQEIFPNGGDECVYRNAPLNFHGEASISSWNYSVVHAGDSRIDIEFNVELRRSPFRLTRTMSMERGFAGFRMHSRAVNLSDEDLLFMWGHHPAIGGAFLADGLHLHVPARSYLNHDIAVSERMRMVAGFRADWPVALDNNGNQLDLSLIPGESARFSEFGYITDLDDGWYGLTSYAHRFGFGLAWPRRVFPYLWLWQERRGSTGYPWYGRCSVMAVEPFTSIPGSGLVSAIEAGTAPILSAHGELETDIAAIFYDTSRGDVHSIRNDGTVLFRET